MNDKRMLGILLDLGCGAGELRAGDEDPRNESAIWLEVMPVFSAVCRGAGLGVGCADWKL